MYAVEIELGFNVPHNFDYVEIALTHNFDYGAGIFFATTCNEHYIKLNVATSVK